MAKNRKNLFWNFLDNLAGDKVVWIIALMLILFSIVCIFSSTSQMTNADVTRVDILKSQLVVTALGIALIIGCYQIRSLKFYRFIAQFGFIVSLALLSIIVFKLIGLGARKINEAWRIIKIGSFQLHVYEVVKVAMVMYLAWAVDSFKNRKFTIVNQISKLSHMEWLAKPVAQKCIYIYFPMSIVAVCVAQGSGSSAAFIAMVMTLTVLISGLWGKKVFKPIIGIMLLVFVAVFLYKITDGAILKPFGRAAYWEKRIEGYGAHVDRFMEADYKSPEYYEELDALRQPYSAKIAIHQGRIFGKGPGQSTQRYVVPIMYEDYMYSFILEEYGLLGGILVMALYLSLLARGALIAKNCNDRFAQIVVAGLVILISGQAFLHMMVNTEILPQTGQTLPIISHGKTSFVIFCIAFGILLSISRISKKGLDKETKDADPLMNVKTEDEHKPEMECSIADLDDAENRMYDNEE